jgi:hypothetical protein
MRKIRKDKLMNIPKAILFDLDDSIISFTSAIIQSIADLVKEVRR